MKGMAVRCLGENKWLIDIRLGRAERHRVVFEGTENEAQIYHLRLKKQFGKKSTGVELVEDLVEEYLEHSHLHDESSTYREKKRVFFSHVLGSFGRMHPDFITSEMLELYQKRRIAEIRAAGRGNKGGHRMVNLEIIYLRGLVSWAKEKGYCSDDLPRCEPLKYRRPIPAV